jgi:hypothetical protein
VHLRVDLTTLTNLTETPGELAGYGPVVAEIARNVADRQHQSGWQATVTEPDTGDIVATIPLRRRPTASPARNVRAHYPTCLWPGCRTPATQSDLDHRQPHSEGGPTTERNPGPFCRHHHATRHRDRRTYRRLPNGHHHFTSPLRHTHTTPARGP